MLTRRQFGAGLALAGVAAPHVARAQAPIRLRLAHAAAEVHPGHIAALRFKEALEKLAPGRFNLQLFPNRQLGEDKANVEAAIAGTIDLCGASGVLFPLVTGRPALDAPQLPFIIKDYDHFTKLSLGAAGQALLSDLSDAGLVGLQLTDIGTRNFLSVGKPVKKIADFAGLKTRIVPVPLHKAIWETVGTAPIGLPYGEVYGALQTKVIDAVEINVSSMLGENLWEVGKFMTLTGHYPWHNVIAMNKAKFDSLPKDLQEAIRQAGRDSTAPTLQYTKDQDLNAREDLKKKGVQFFDLEDLAEMKKKMAPLVEQYAKKSPLIDAYVKAAQA
ncbi:MAG: TRAP transporter substrate-binding protein [Methylobacteriaceae bacterium]|nr:TRAP transporter substrate-binding protein [Methylobacteriaceae bacterium]